VSDEVSRIFNSTITAAAISAAFELGLFEILEDERPLVVATFCRAHQLDPATVRAILYALGCFDIIRLDGGHDRVSRGSLFAEVFRQKGYFMWLVRGYGRMWQNLGELARLEHWPTPPSDPGTALRDGRFIAQASCDYGAVFVDPTFDTILDAGPCTVVADLGCGSAGRLQRLIGRHPGLRGIGIDINPDSVDLAREAVRRARASERITILHGDVRRLDPISLFREVDVLLCFFMGHDLWPRPQCLEVFRSLLDVFPQVERFLFCDTYRSNAPPSPGLPTFTLGFEVSHAVMGQYVPSEAEWRDLFEESGWCPADWRPINIPYSSIFDLRPRPPAATGGGGLREAAAPVGIDGHRNAESSSRGPKSDPEARLKHCGGDHHE
jgi:SAM-dependent methyltransferase